MPILIRGQKGLKCTFKSPTLKQSLHQILLPKASSQSKVSIPEAIEWNTGILEEDLDRIQSGFYVLFGYIFETGQEGPKRGFSGIGSAIP
jgi:hypothetical protein